ncbi:linoleate diol synthase [Stereum hirsutum FP-91666 SS1]|uniref:linoleate diol synthase n=1 Tax=Stereum hirsutum (strain FP-91666) TaxID=721885 RepID=UPI000440C0C4|nr:linoleate diol synthase [Stereum hirsutum FP-91666 SS1]EIM86629.1 linoleate diol synthase [Stereum hirsutum FP-91666 SS1]
MNLRLWWAAVVDAIGNINDLDDRKMLLEHVLTILSTKMPAGTIRTRIENKTIQLLYNDLAHPPATLIGPKYARRAADGSGNNIDIPDMGKAGTPYARSVQQTHPLPRNTLPDAGLVFDTLLRRDEFVPHPAGLSSMMFAFAALVIHTVFRTSHKDVNINETSSYCDLAPLYGHDQESGDKLRVRDGRGLLLPDTFAEDRLMLLPPAVCVLLVLFSRNHNYIANKLLEINERGTYQDPDSISEDDPQRMQKLLEQEEDIFQTARLINCAWFGTALFADYFGSILGLVRSGSKWSLSPFGEMRKEDHSLFERGRGNVCSVEFNCLYRWHATTSEADEKWVTQLLGHIFNDKPVEELGVKDFLEATAKIKEQEPDVGHWTFGGMQRQEDGMFKDSDLASILKNAMEHPAAAFKARGTPEIMRLHEIMGIESNRRWGVCSLNEFRKWNPDAEIAYAAEKLYGDIENLELYVGLQAEQAKPLVDGAGLCPGYTISRAILSDAIALTRGDRFFTADYTPFNMTAWGFADCQRDPEGPGNGSIVGKLLMRALPHEFGENSTYAWFPLQTPESIKGFLAKLGQDHRYNFSRPGDPPVIGLVNEYRDVEAVLKSQNFKQPYAKIVTGIIKDNGSVLPFSFFLFPSIGMNGMVQAEYMSRATRFFIASGDPARGERDQREVLRVLTAEEGSTNTIAMSFYQTTKAVIDEKSFTLSDKRIKNVDIVDALRFIPIRWVATEIAGFTLKTQHQSGPYTEGQLFDMLTDIYTYFFLDVDPSKAMMLEERVKKYVDELHRSIKEHVVFHAGGGLSLVEGVAESIQHLFSGSKTKKKTLPLAEKLFEQGRSADEVANNILALMVGATVELSQSLISVVNVYLDDKNTPSLEALNDPKNVAQLSAYFCEALRVDPPFRGVWREALHGETVGAARIEGGQKVFVDIAHAGMDATVFAEPKSIDLNREMKKYLIGDGAVRCLGLDITMKIMSQVLRAVFEYDHLRRGPGQSGKLKRYRTNAVNTLRYEYLGKDHLPTPWATSMIVQYNVELKSNEK